MITFPNLRRSSVDDGRLQLTASGTMCEVRASKALAMDDGYWDIYVGTGKDLPSFRSTHHLYHVIVNGKIKIKIALIKGSILLHIDIKIYMRIHSKNIVNINCTQTSTAF